MYIYIYIYLCVCVCKVSNKNRTDLDKAVGLLGRFSKVRTCTVRSGNI